MIAGMIVGALKVRTAATNVYRFFPRWVWLCVLGAVLVLVLSWLHGVQVGRSLKAAREQGAASANQAWQERFDAMRLAAEGWKREAEARQNRISEEEQLRHEAESRATASRADSLRVRGPGKAACPGPVDRSGVSEASGGPAQPASAEDGAGGGVPGANRLAAVPWGWLVDKAEACDVMRSEVTAWRSWYEREAASLQLRGTVSVE
jgi:hypothetical protein